MKKLLATAVLSTVSMGAFAYDAQVQIDGEVLTESCTINNSAVAPAVLDVKMPTILVSALQKPGDWAMNTPFTLSLKDCPDNVRVTWEKSSTVDGSTGALINTIAGSNAQVRILDSKVVPIDLNADPGIVVTGGSADLKYFSQYYAKTVPVTPGKISTYGYITLSY